MDAAFKYKNQCVTMEILMEEKCRFCRGLFYQQYIASVFIAKVGNSFFKKILETK